MGTFLIRLVVLGDGQAAADAEGAAGYFQARGRLAAFEFAAIHQFDDPGDLVRIETGGDDFLVGLALHDVAFQDFIEGSSLRRGLHQLRCGLGGNRLRWWRCRSLNRRRRCRLDEVESKYLLTYEHAARCTVEIDNQGQEYQMQKT